MARPTSFQSITSLFCSLFTDSSSAFTHSTVVKLLTTPFYHKLLSENDPSVSFHLMWHCCNDKCYNQLSDWSLLIFPLPKSFTTTASLYLEMLLSLNAVSSLSSLLEGFSALDYHCMFFFSFFFFSVLFLFLFLSGFPFLCHVANFINLYMHYSRSYSKILLFKKYLDLIHLFYFKCGNLPLFVKYIFLYLFFLLVLPIMWDCLRFLLVGVLLKPFTPYFGFLHPCFPCIGALLTPFPTFIKTPSSKSPLSIEVLANLPSTATDEQVLSLFTSEFADLLPYFLHFHSLCTTSIPSLFLVDPFSEMPSLYAVVGVSVIFLLKAQPMLILSCISFIFVILLGISIAYIAYHSLFEGEPSFIGGNYAQYLLEAPSHILTSSYYGLPNLYKDHWE